MFAKLLSWIDGPIISRVVAAIVAGIMGVVVQHLSITADQTAQLQQAITSIVTLIAYAATHGGIKSASLSAGNPIAPPAGTTVG